MEDDFEEDDAAELRAQYARVNANALDNDLAEVLAKHYGFLPLSVRYSAARAAREIAHDWATARSGH